MARKKKVKKTRKPRKHSLTKAHVIAQKLFVSGENYVLVCAELIARAKEKPGRRALEMMQDALTYQHTVRELYAYLDPTTYRMEAK